MPIVKILIGVIEAILKASVEAFLAIASLGLAWLIGISAVVALVVLGLTGFGGSRILKGRKKNGES